MGDKKYIVITTVFKPTVSIKKFSKLNDCIVVVVGDEKTPKGWSCDGVKYYSTEDQKILDFKILEYLPYNHYCRKMVGYLISAKEGAEYIIDTDDDNIPKEGWAFPEFLGRYSKLENGLGFINVYQLFTEKKIWPRGLPLSLILEQFNLKEKQTLSDCKIGIWQGLADEDPDVDAIYRLTSNEPCFFNTDNPIVLGEGTISPFNSQNTMFEKELFPLLYLPAFVTFRFTDILRSLVAQPIMWLYNFNLGFTNATVVQKRNPHDNFKDFISEIPMYLNSEEIIKIVSQNISKSNTISENLFSAYEGLSRAAIVDKKELVLLAAWLKDLDKEF